MTSSQPGSAAAVAAHLRSQGAACASLGSPFYARLLELAARDAEASGAVADVLTDYAHRPRDDGIGLRLLGSVHRLVLSGAAPQLQPHYPNLGGDGDADTAWPLVAAALRSHRAAIRDGLTRAPQTNEVGRSAGLIGGLHHLAGQVDLPVRLLEIGASGGLNLRADAYRVTGHDGSGREQGVGPGDAALTLPGGWDGDAPRAAPLRLVERRGCDVAPVDPTTDDGALTLMSYVWPDQAARWERLRSALAVAHRTPAEVVTAGAADFLADLAPQPGRWTVVWHSVMWQYLDAAEQERVVGRIAHAGGTATRDAPLARVALEPYGDRFLVVVRTWPDVGLGAGREVLPDGMVVLGSANPHGIPLRWV